MPENGGGIALTFDDRHVGEWHALLPLLREFEARATFFVGGAAWLDAQQLGWLRELRDAGCEIGSHGHRHRGVQRHYGADPRAASRYVVEEVMPSMRTLRDGGFDPQSYAYPFGQRTAAFDRELFRQVPHLRATACRRRLLPAHRVRSIYHRPGSGARLHFALGIDDCQGNRLDGLAKVLRRAAGERSIALFYAHRPDACGGGYRVAPGLLRSLLEIARELRLRSLTVRELD